MYRWLLQRLRLLHIKRRCSWIFYCFELWIRWWSKWICLKFFYEFVFMSFCVFRCCILYSYPNHTKIKKLPIVIVAYSLWTTSTLGQVWALIFDIWLRSKRFFMILKVFSRNSSVTQSIFQFDFVLLFSLSVLRLLGN